MLLRTEIPQYFINKVQETLGESYESLIELGGVYDLKDYIVSVIMEMLENSDFREIRTNIRRDVKRQKKRWYDSLVTQTQAGSSKKNKTELLKEVNFASEFMKMYGVEGFKKTYSVPTLDKLIELRLREVESWVTDDSLRLSDYQYIRDKSTSQIKKSIRMDVIIIICNILEKDYDWNFSNIIKGVPLQYADHPIAASNRGKLKISDDRSMVVNGAVHSVSEYSPSENYSLYTLVNQAVLSEEHLLRSIDEKDMEIFQAVINLRADKFMTDGLINVSIGTIVRAVYGSDGRDNYTAVKNRLTKMANIRFNVEQKDTKRFYVFGIFDRLEINPSTDIVEIYVNEEIKRSYINNNVIRTYSDRIKGFSEIGSNVLIFPLQKERFLCYFRQENYDVELDYLYFLHKLQFTSKRKDINIPIIERCLTEFVSLGITVKSFNRKRDVFHISFLPVESYEVADLIGNQQMSNLIETVEPEQLSLPID